MCFLSVGNASVTHLACGYPKPLTASFMSHFLSLTRELGQNSGNCYNLYITVGGPKDKPRFFTAFTNHLIRTLFWGLNLQILFLSRKDSYSRIACERRRSVCRLIHEWPQHIPIHTFNLSR